MDDEPVFGPKRFRVVWFISHERLESVNRRKGVAPIPVNVDFHKSLWVMMTAEIVAVSFKQARRVVELRWGSTIRWSHIILLGAAETGARPSLPDKPSRYVRIRERKGLE